MGAPASSNSESDDVRVWLVLGCAIVLVAAAVTACVGDDPGERSPNGDAAAPDGGAGDAAQGKGTCGFGTSAFGSGCTFGR